MNDKETLPSDATSTDLAAVYEPPAVVASFSIDELRRDAAAAVTPG